MLLGNLKYRQKTLFLLAFVFILFAAGLFIVYRVSRESHLKGHAEQLQMSAYLTDDLIRKKKDEMKRLVSFFQNNRTLIEYLYVSTVLKADKEPLLGMLRPFYISQKIDVLMLCDAGGRLVAGLDTKTGQAQAGGCGVDGFSEETADGFKESNGGVMVFGSGRLKYMESTLGHIVVGKYIDGEFLSELASITGCELFLIREGGIAASSLDMDEKPVYRPVGGKLAVMGETYSVLERDVKGPDGRFIGRIVVGLSDARLQDSLHRLKLSMAAMLAGIVLISVILALLLIRALVNPLNKMASFVDRVGRGEFDSMLDVKGRDEITVLSERFNEMQIQLGAQREDIERYTSSLEYLVEERTKELQRVQAQLLHAQKMESLGTMAGGIAHDFNNLLSAILGYASFVKETMDESHPHYRYWDIVEQAALRGTELTSHLLTFSRGRVEVAARKTVEINALIKELLRLLARTVDKSITIRTILSSEDGLYVSGDSGALYQAFLNICLNARDAMPGGGSLTIETMGFQSTEDFVVGHLQAKAGPYVQVNITDTGVGMTRELTERIFEPFFTTKESGRGTGLGLAIVYSVIRGHDGFIDVYSEPGKGTTMKLYIPSGKESPSQKEEEPELAVTEAVSGTIMVVDDEEPLRRLCKEVLEGAGYEVITAKDGFEAIDMFGGKPHGISLVIMDMVMPGMSGHETMKRLKAIEPSIKVLISSGFSREIDVSWAGEKGVAGFIEKPYRSQALLKSVKEAITGPA